MPDRTLKTRLVAEVGGYVTPINRAAAATERFASTAASSTATASRRMTSSMAGAATGAARAGTATGRGFTEGVRTAVTGAALARTTSTVGASLGATSAPAGAAGRRAGQAYATGLSSRVKAATVGLAGTVAGGLKEMLAPLLGILAVSKAVDLVKDSYKDAEENLAIQRQTTKVIQTTGAAAGVTRKEVEELSMELAAQAGISDEAAQKTANLILTFKNIKNIGPDKIFDETTRAAIDMSKSLGTDARSSATMLGKALNDPLRGLTALQRVGVTFDNQQRQQIKTMVEAGDTLGAQKVILKEVQSEFGGAAAAMATPTQKLSTLWGRFVVTLGTKLIPVVDKSVGFLTDKAVPALVDFAGEMQDVGDAAKQLGGALGGGIALGFKAIGLAAQGIGAVLGPIVSAFKDLPGPVQQVVLVLGLAAAASRIFSGRLDRISGRVATAGAAAGRWSGNMRTWGGNVRAMGQLAREAAPDVGRLNGAIGAIGTGNGNIARMAQSFERAAGQATRFPRAAGAAAAAMTGMRGAAKGLIGALGGPWGLALAGAGVGLMLWQKHQADAAAAVAAHKERVKELTDAIVEDGNKVGKTTKQNIIDKLVDDGVFDQAKKFGISVQTATLAAQGNKAAIDSVKKSLKEHGTTVQIDSGKLQAGAKQSRVYTDEAIKVSNAILGETDSTKEGIHAAKQKTAAEKASADATKKAADEAKRVPPAIATYVAAQKRAQTAAENTARANKDLAADLDDANSKFFATRDASRAYQQALADARAAAKEQGKAGTSDKTQKGRDNSEKLDTFAKAGLAKLQDLYQNGASDKKLRAALATTKSDLRGVALGFGMTGKEADKYVRDSLGKIPKDITTKISTDTAQAKKNVAEARAAAKALGTTYDALPKSVQTELKVLGEAKARAAAGAVGVDYDSLPPDKKTKLIADLGTGKDNSKTVAEDLGTSYDQLPKEVQTQLKAVGEVTAKSKIQEVLDKAHNKLMTITAKTHLGHVLDELARVERASHNKTFSVTAVYQEIHPGDNLRRHRQPGAAANGALIDRDGVQRMASGGVAHQAAITRRPILWGEAGPELYAPLTRDARRGRAVQLLRAGADFYGYEMIRRDMRRAAAGYLSNTAVVSSSSSSGGLSGRDLAELAALINGVGSNITHAPVTVERMYGADIPAVEAEARRRRFLAAAGTRKAGQ